jgi:hypothetical protein
MKTIMGEASRLAVVALLFAATGVVAFPQRKVFKRPFEIFH